MALPINSQFSDAINRITNNGINNFVQDYDYITRSIISNLPSGAVDSKTLFWYENASLVNNPDSDAAASRYIRTVTAYALEWNGFAPGSYWVPGC